MNIKLTAIIKSHVDDVLDIAGVSTMLYARHRGLNNLTWCQSMTFTLAAGYTLLIPLINALVVSDNFIMPTAYVCRKYCLLVSARSSNSTNKR